MKINNQTGAPIVNPYQKVQAVHKIEKTKAVNNQDQLEISQEAKKMLEKNQAESSRKEKINAVKQQIQDGTYKVNSEEIANTLYSKWFK